VNLTTPGGTSIVGTVVGKRQCSDPVRTELSFNGMINGSPASATASATERWSDDSNAVIDVTSIDSWSGPLGRPNPITLHVSQTSPGIVTVNGVPVAINGQLKAACTSDTGSGDGGASLAYVFTNPGQGSGQVVLLPNTGEGPMLFNPLVIVAMLITPGIILVMLSSLLRRRAAKQSGYSDPWLD
jgi:hypothetical protein